MTTWVDNKAILVASLATGKYTQNPNNKDLTEDWGKNKFSIELIIPTEEQTSAYAFSTDIVTLKIGYVVMSNKDFDVAVDAFRDVMDDIRGLAPFVGFDTEATFERLETDNKKLIASITFHFGLRVCA